MELSAFDQPVDSGIELMAMLDRNQIEYVVENDLYCFSLVQRDCRWRTCCKPVEQAILIYGIYPFPVQQTQAAQAACTSINSRILYGSLFFQEDRLVFRTCADLFDPYTAAEVLTRAVEYNASVIMEFWKELAHCTQDGAGLPTSV